MIDLIDALGLWNWVILGFILLLIELIAPGIFCVWLGLAALVTAALALAGSFIGVLQGWQEQVLVFLVLSVAFVLVTRQFAGRIEHSDAPFLNRRTDEMIGLTVTLSEPIKDGTGRAHIDDTIWRVTGPDLPKGAKVRLIAFHGGAFQVESEKQTERF